MADGNHQGNHQSNQQISDNQQKIIDFCTIPRSSSEIIEMLGISNQTKNRQKHIAPLVEQGIHTFSYIFINLTLFNNWGGNLRNFVYICKTII